MYDNQLESVFANYIKKFEIINAPGNEEYYKWQIVKQFRPLMDEALNSSDEVFPTKLLEVKNLTENLIDSFTQPFYGLVKFAEKEPETVKNMFQKLFADGISLHEKQRRISDFLLASHALREKHYPGSFRYHDDMHSVTSYLFLYDPDHNYLFKATNARDFADCIGFYDDWGTGDAVDLSVYYRMCDHVVEAIKNSNALLKTDASRFDSRWGIDPKTLYEDPEKHVLVFDLIFCCSVYGLFDGVTYERPTSKERQLFKEKREKAQKLFDELTMARNQAKELDEAKETIMFFYSKGSQLVHRQYGKGVVLDNNGDIMMVEFDAEGKRKMGVLESVANGVVAVDSADYFEKTEKYKICLRKKKDIERRLENAEKNFAPYSEFLG